MKKLLSVLLAIGLILSAAGCATIPPNEADPSSDDTPQNHEPVPPSDPFAGSGSSPDDDVLSSNTADTAVPSGISWQDVGLDLSQAQVLDTSVLSFTEVLGSRKRYPDSLPDIIGFQYPYVFYEQMAVITEGADPEEAALYVGRYSVETREVQEFAIERFTSISNESRLIVDENRAAYMYCALDEQGELKMNIVLFDFLHNTQKVIASYSAYNVFGYAKKLSEEELVFFLYEAVPDGSQQIVLRYHLDSGELHEIYRGQTMGGYRDSSTSTKDIWAIDTRDGQIDLLLQQLVNGSMVSYLRTIDREGNMLRETELDALSMYDSLEDTADSLVTKGDYAFIHYFQLNKSEDNTNAPFVILRREDTGCRLLEWEGAVTPNDLCGITSSDLPYVVFHLYESDDLLAAFNVNTNEGFLLDLSGEEVRNSVLDPAGNLLVETRRDEKTSWHLFPAEYILEKLN